MVDAGGSYVPSTYLLSQSGDKLVGVPHDTLRVHRHSPGVTKVGDSAFSCLEPFPEKVILTVKAFDRASQLGISSLVRYCREVEKPSSVRLAKKVRLGAFTQVLRSTTRLHSFCRRRPLRSSTKTSPSRSSIPTTSRLKIPMPRPHLKIRFVNGPASYAYLTNAKAVAELHVVMSKATHSLKRG